MTKWVNFECLTPPWLAMYTVDGGGEGKSELETKHTVGHMSKYSEGLEFGPGPRLVAVKAKS